MKCLRPRWCLAFAVFILIAVGVRLLFKPRPISLQEFTTVQAGKVLFTHEWTPGDPLAGGDGLGPVFNATSCAACHHQGGLGGAGGVQHNVTSYVWLRIGTPLQGVLHSRASTPQPHARGAAIGSGSLQGVLHSRASTPAFQETVDHLTRLTAPAEGFDERERPWRRPGPPPWIHFSQRNTPALFGAGLIDAIPEQVILAEARRQTLRPALAGHALRLADGRIGKFGWKAQTASLSDFVRAACANELGLSNPDHSQPTSLAKPDYVAPGVDLTARQCDQMTAFVASLPRPVQRLPNEPLARADVEEGSRLFSLIGCAACHTPNLGPVQGLYSDLLLHRMHEKLASITRSYGAPPARKNAPEETASPDEWRTPPLWGIADSGPYLHDGRAATLEDAILLHGGQAATAADCYRKLPVGHQDRLIAFLKSLRAP